MPLFGKKKKENKSERRQTALSQKETTYFGKNLMIKGRVSGNGNIIILGGLKGEFNLKGRIKIAQPAKIKGEVKADVISVDGNVEGSLIAEERVHLDQTAIVEGRIDTPKLSIIEGAIFNGEIEMSGQSTTSAPSIRSDSSRSSQGSLSSAEKPTNS